MTTVNKDNALTATRFEHVTLKNADNCTMKIPELCPNCGAMHYITIKEKITFTSEGKIYQCTATRINDAFYEIIDGIFSGNLVHIWDVLKTIML